LAIKPLTSSTKRFTIISSMAYAEENVDPERIAEVLFTTGFILKRGPRL
jgi:hypothetical protein